MALLVHNFQVELEFRTLVFVEGEKQEKKNLKARTRINNKLKLHVTPGLGIESGPQWWEAGTLPAPHLFDVTSKYSTANCIKKENCMAFYSLL